MLLKKNRFIRRLTHTGLSRSEVHVLIETDAHGTSSIKLLQPLLRMDQSSVSRVVKSLITDGLLESGSSERDRRVKLLSLTSKGRRACDQIDSVAGKIFDQFISRLTKAEAAEVLELFRRIADWHGQPSCPVRNDENGIRMQQRRMSRALGVLSQSLFGSGLNASQWHVFSAICYSSYPLNPKKLAIDQGLAANSISIILEKLSDLGYVERTQARHDSRYVELRATDLGMQFLHEVESRCSEDLAEMLEGFSLERIEKLVAVMQRYIDQDPAGGPAALPDGFDIKRIQSRAARSEVRAFALEEIVRRGHAEFAPSRIIDP